MSQTSSLSVPGGGGASVRANMNTLFAALFSSNSGVAAPSPTVAGMLWLDTGVSPAVLRIRNAANTAWIALNPETIAANTLRGNPTGVAAAIQDVSMAQLRTMLGFDLSNGTSGYELRPNGIIEQWGVGTSNASGVLTVTFPLAWPNAMRSFVVSPRVVSAARIAVFHTPTLSSLTVNTFNDAGAVAATEVYWRAIGY
jgi:hypothetical protein